MPEIETVARKLRRAVIGKRIADVRLSGLPLRRQVDASFARQLQGRTILKIHRRGKYLVAEMDSCSFWLIHLGMSGRIFHCRPSGEIEKHTHAIIRFSDDSELRYKDHRRFGLLAVYQVSRLNEIPEVKALGIDPLSARFREEWLLLELKKSRQEIKSFLLDQRKIAGLGNIYVCEALFRARIHPARRCYTLTPKESTRLRSAIQRILRAAIRHRGTSFSDFLDTDGERGGHQDFLQVFQKEGQKCPRCKAGICRLRQGNRSSFFCPRCQPDGH